MSGGEFGCLRSQHASHVGRLRPRDSLHASERPPVSIRVARFVVPVVASVLGVASVVAASPISASPAAPAGRWEQPVPIYTGEGVGPPRDVSCPTADFCAAVSTGGVYFERDGSWSGGQQVGSY